LKNATLIKADETFFAFNENNVFIKIHKGIIGSN